MNNPSELNPDRACSAAPEKSVSESHQGASHPDVFAENTPCLDGTKPDGGFKHEEVSDDDVAFLFCEVAKT